MHKFNSFKSKPVYIGTLAGLLFTGLFVGCFKKTSKYSPHEPLMVTGTVTGNTGYLVWIEDQNKEVFEYNLCSGPNLLATNEGGSVFFSFNSENNCYNETSAVHNVALDAKKDSEDE